MPAKVLILAFDALEETLVDRWAAEGHLPTFAKLGGRAATHPLDNTVTYLPDTLWAELTTGKSAPAAGLYWQPEQVHVGEARLRANRPDDFDLPRFWRHASDAGKRVAVIDAVYALPEPGLNGVVLRDWGAHSAGFGRGSDPGSSTGSGSSTVRCPPTAATATRSAPSTEGESATGSTGSGSSKGSWRQTLRGAYRSSGCAGRRSSAQRGRRCAGSRRAGSRRSFRPTSAGGRSPAPAPSPARRTER